MGWISLCIWSTFRLSQGLSTGLKDIEEIPQTVEKNGIKAIFFDELDIHSFTQDLMVTKITEKNVDYIWIVPATNDLHYRIIGGGKDGFTYLDLAQNFRNSREIVKFA